MIRHPDDNEDTIPIDSENLAQWLRSNVRTREIVPGLYVHELEAAPARGRVLAWCVVAFWSGVVGYGLWRVCVAYPTLWYVVAPVGVLTLAVSSLSWAGRTLQV